MDFTRKNSVKLLLPPCNSVRKILLSLLLLPGLLLAREVWLTPASYRVAAGTATPLKLLIGDNFVGEAWPHPLRKVLRFVRVGATDSTNLLPALRADSLAPLLRCPRPGTHAAVLLSAPVYTEMAAPAFNAYLRHHGLRPRADTTAPGREAYRRCAKLLVLATGPGQPRPATDTAYRRVLKLPLELVPEQNPYWLRQGAALTVRVLRRGQPAVGVLVQVWEATPAPAAPFTTRTNAQGRVLLRLRGPGPYLLAAVGIEKAPPALAARADWLSTWATLTFGGPLLPAKGR